MAKNDDLIKIYDKCSEGYHKVDDFRSKLLGFLPLASGITVLGSLYIEHKTDDKSLLNAHQIAIGLFGLVVTFRLLVYELKGIEKCTQFIKLGKWLEEQMEENEKSYDTDKKVKKGFFIELLKGDDFFTEPIATGFVYSIVLALWTYVGLLDFNPYCYIIPAVVFALSFILVYKHWQKVKNKNYDLETSKKKK